MRAFCCISNLRCALLLCCAALLGGAKLLAQTPVHHSHQAESHTALNDDRAVISIRYDCIGDTSGQASTCTKKIAKQDFDALVRAIDPNMTADGRQALAAEYARLVIMAAEARRRGLDQLPEMRTLLDFSALQLLASRLVRDINSSVLAVSSDEIEKYFHDHERDYREVVLSRLFIPAPVKRAGEERTQAAGQAQQTRTRAIGGEEFALLQREIKGASPDVRLGPMPCRSLPESHRQVCDLEPKEISSILADNTGYSIYRLESSRRRELNDVRDEIRSTLERQRTQDAIQRARTPVSLDLDEQYFGKLPKPDLASHHGMHFPHAGAPTPEQAHSHQH
jgi:hypothetical protein